MPCFHTNSRGYSLIPVLDKAMGVGMEDCPST